ncbi:zinc finger protein Xfin-like [Sabethes cyaneus]|uniref:zinc finger protein Xfin-like n=1 Tax=Sabethes cyaneus TaxID=53552 RepID=UPI00237E7FD0|nr:zinc finger protein Xfin-like [Sabethes cyaneus]
MDLSTASKEDPFSVGNFFFHQDLPVVPSDNPESYCRLCLTTPGVEAVFPPNGEPNLYVLELIGKYIGIDLTDSPDEFRCAICQSCQLILDQFDLFRQNCLKADIAIRRRRLGLDKIKSEPLDDHEVEDGEEPAYIRLADRHYQCRICLEVFPSLTAFMNHCKEHHPEESKVFKCKYCTKSFMTKTARLQHIRSHQPNNAQEMDMNSDRLQVCEKCMVTFDSYKLLKIHLKDHHSNDPKQDPLICITCQKQFSRITILRNHILRVHLGKLPHVCKHCGISFGYNRQLLVHLQSDHGVVISAPELELTGQSFNEEDDHEDDIHVPIVSLSPVPGTSGTAKPIRDCLPTPSPSHSQAKSTTGKNKSGFKCTECTAECETQEELRSHRKIHQDPSWWKCVHCRNFVKHQKMHLMKKHPSINVDDVDSAFQLRYRCWFCRMYFKSMQQMEQHASTHKEAFLGTQREPERHRLRPDARKRQSSAMASPAVSSLIPSSMPGSSVVSPTVMTAQPPLPIGPESFPLLLSQLENGAWDYLRDMARFLNPNNTSAFNIKVEKDSLDTSINNIVDLSSASDRLLSANNSSTSLSSYDIIIKDDPDQIDDMENDSEDDTYIRLENRSYQCRVCSETFRHLLQIRKHTKAQHPTEWKSFKCEHCKRRFPSAAIRDRHAHFHTLNHAFKCSDCDQMFDSRKRVEQHYALFHDTNSSSFTIDRTQCATCNLAFVEKKYHDLHSRIYHQRKPQRLKNLTDTIQVCERCLATFSSRELLVEHIKTMHVSDPPLKTPICPRCSKDLKTMTLLRIHLLVVHLGMLPFVCQNCNAAFATRHWLLKHIEKEHTEIPIHSCTTCDETFDDEKKLAKHEASVHPSTLSSPPAPPLLPPPPLPPPPTVVNPVSVSEVFPCTKCDKKLDSKDLFEKHLIKAHPTFMLLYKCPLCVKPIRYRRQHMRVHHDVEYDPKEHRYQTRYKCHCCAKLFKQKSSLTTHQTIRAFQCSRCMLRFKTKKLLTAHSRKHRANRTIRCPDCGLDFGYPARLEEHRLRFHSSTSTEILKLHNCPYCPKVFMSLSNRERHITTNHPQNDFQVRCGHCTLPKTDSTSLRKHYRSNHPNERVTFKCHACDKVYLNLSSYKDHLKKHTKEQKTNNDSTSSENTTTNVTMTNGKNVEIEKDTKTGQTNGDTATTSVSEINENCLEANETKLQADTACTISGTKVYDTYVDIKSEIKVEPTEVEVKKECLKDENSYIEQSSEESSINGASVEKIAASSEEVALKRAVVGEVSSQSIDEVQSQTKETTGNNVLEENQDSEKATEMEKQSNKTTEERETEQITPDTTKTSATESEHATNEVQGKETPANIEPPIEAAPITQNVQESLQKTTVTDSTTQETITTKSKEDNCLSESAGAKKQTGAVDVSCAKETEIKSVEPATEVEHTGEPVVTKLCIESSAKLISAPACVNASISESKNEHKQEKVSNEPQTAPTVRSSVRLAKAKAAVNSEPSPESSTEKPPPAKRFRAEKQTSEADADS